MRRLAPIAAALGMLAPTPALALAQCARTFFPVYQFPANAIPRIDGEDSDWSTVGADYAIGNAALTSDDGLRRHPDAKTLDVSVKVAWVKGLNRLYFLYEATDDYWDFADPGLHNDTFELAVDGNRSGGPFIARFHPEIAPRHPTPGERPPPGGYISDEDAWFDFQGEQAQNYHIFTPAAGKDWAIAWGPQAQWIKRLPFANIAYHYDFKPGQPGKLVMEFWITPFDFASADGPSKSVESTLAENHILGLAWAAIDYDGPGKAHGFWNLSSEHTMYGQASQLCAFKLMPLEARWQKPIAADWSFTIVDRDRRVVAFHDDSHGEVTRWNWDFGDGQSSDARDPIHRYARPGKYVVMLTVDGPAGTARLSKVWDVSFVGDPDG
ncbi:MAG: PKD domain-containing protein [Sphingomonas sp.]